MLLTLHTSVELVGYQQLVRVELAHQLQEIEEHLSPILGGHPVVLNHEDRVGHGRVLDNLHELGEIWTDPFIAVSGLLSNADQKNLLHDRSYYFPAHTSVA